MKALNTVFRTVRKVICERLFSLAGINEVVEKSVVKSAEQCTVDEETTFEICSCFEKVGEVARHFQFAVELLLAKINRNFDVVPDTHRVPRVVPDTHRVPR